MKDCNIVQFWLTDNHYIQLVLKLYIQVRLILMKMILLIILTIILKKIFARADKCACRRRVFITYYTYIDDDDDDNNNNVNFCWNDHTVQGKGKYRYIIIMKTSKTEHTILPQGFRKTNPLFTTRPFSPWGHVDKCGSFTTYITLNIFSSRKSILDRRRI